MREALEELRGVETAPGASSSPGFLASHATEVVIGCRARIGAEATSLHRVAIGCPSGRHPEDMPAVGDGVFVEGDCLSDRTRFGDGVHIRADSLATRDMPDQRRVTCGAGIQIDSP